MAPDLHLDPDAVARLAAVTRRIADGLRAVPPRHGPSAADPVRSVGDAVAELLAFAAAAETTAGRARDADRSIVRELRAVDGPAACGIRHRASGPARGAR